VKRHRESRASQRLRLSVSCPNLVPETRPKIYVSLRHISPTSTRPARALTLSATPFFPAYTPLLQATSVNTISRRNYSKPCNCGCPCPFPCGPCGCPGGCSCLPPPCNTPPRCVQYMTGYYYYPYGTWFCGPYHVTGTCCPVGPCGPCGGCGPCGACGPCGPCVKCAPSCICPSALCPSPAGASTICTPAVCPMPVMNNQPAPRDVPRTGVVPGNQIKYPLSQESARHSTKSGISRFFPFNNAVPPVPPLGTEPKKTLPTSTVLSSLMCPYSTQAQNREGFANEFEPQENPNVTSVDYEQPAHLNGFSEASAQTMFHDFEPEFQSPAYMRRTCPPLERPRTLMTLEQRDRPRFRAGAFDYASIPNYRNPYPRPNIDIEFKAYES
jgi:hypothetical protein